MVEYNTTFIELFNLFNSIYDNRFQLRVNENDKFVISELEEIN